MFLDTLPVELIADILAELSLADLIVAAYLSRRLHTVASDPALNPWRKPILRNLCTHNYEPALANLSVRSIVPRHNWIDILTRARPSFLLFQATLPNLKQSEWEEAFRRRFLPSWAKWKKDAHWKEAYLKILHRVWHRSTTSCTTDEAWTKYMVLNRNGSANQLQTTSRGFDPFVIFDDMKFQNNMTHLDTQQRVILELTDVRIIAFGTLSRPKTTLTINPNAHMLVQPPGIGRGHIKSNTTCRRRFFNADDHIQDYGAYPLMSVLSVPHYLSQEYEMTSNTYTQIQHPVPSAAYANYPFFTPGGGDRRWISSPANEDNLHWVGPLMLIAQIIVPSEDAASDTLPNAGRQQFASFGWSDLWAVAPWMDERITKRIDGPGLGN
ncbi:hypothetical protein AGABI1DRAFT_106215 [Agaricus bisporus var. burnettii JB137-S8]|uniref:F-box domain-containing protein n=1 Tax=Agaricus bisporus var. burnettii (strain JB137-S8 / ATCC MYA-4627 / FGSC 10392) TaxID=597362 RepID=K5X9G7_AGABU|nr:uncharacterized protein AGABI1DRAFT_106215 [Agaricus bisporus var. burnettii JB137-S8]EKM79873.1 hypothetical protein AGABI1DRAFT_106215 [Agaricus bisporus var. burnettii JB137-S8]